MLLLLVKFCVCVLFFGCALFATNSKMLLVFLSHFCKRVYCMLHSARPQPLSKSFALLKFPFRRVFVFISDFIFIVPFFSRRPIRTILFRGFLVFSFCFCNSNLFAADGNDSAVFSHRKMFFIGFLGDSFFFFYQTTHRKTSFANRCKKN